MIRFLLVSIATAIPLAAVAEGGIEGSDIRFLGYVASLVGAVAVVLFGARSFVKSEIKDHERVEEDRAEARNALLLARIDARDASIAGRFDTLIQRLEDRGVFVTRGSGSWDLK